VTTGLFGTDGIRGVVNREPLTPATLGALGRAIGEVLRDSGAPPRALIGRDTRQSGPMVGSAVVSGLLSAGIDVTVAAVLPTPAIALLTRRERFGLGVVISASHNPAGDNGVKLFTADARKADPAFERRIEARLAKPKSPVEGVTGAYRTWHGAGEAYVGELCKEFKDLDLTGLTIVADCANGAVCDTAPRALEHLGARVIEIHAKPNGRNINRGCGATRPEVVARAVKRHVADLGVSFDGDGDRALFSDERGRVIDGDATMAILARHLKARRRLPKKTVVATVMSNVGLQSSLAEVGCRLVRTDVGDRSVVLEMDRGRFALGGEQSGHVIVRRGNRLIGDGLATTLHLLDALVESQGPLSVLAGCFTQSPQILVNVRVVKKPGLKSLPGVMKRIREVERELGDAGRVLVRYSGTEPLLRVMVEGPDRRGTSGAANRIAAEIEQEIGSSK